MRRLLIKLVAIETMLVGWLSYWIFLVYANNPSVSAGLGDQLTRFPQLAFTTVDIAVLVIIASFAITLAFKFHRGLRPGIRLERALRMLRASSRRNRWLLLPLLAGRTVPSTLESLQGFLLLQV